jgi:hypothetical protein
LDQLACNDHLQEQPRVARWDLAVFYGAPMFAANYLGAKLGKQAAFGFPRNSALTDAMCC